MRVRDVRRYASTPRLNVSSVRACLR